MNSRDDDSASNRDTTEQTDEATGDGPEDSGFELTRRDAVVALAATGAGVAGVGSLVWGELDDAEEGLSEEARDTVTGVARTIYPTDVDGIEEFVETYVVGRLSDRPEYVEGMREATEALDDYARTWNDTTFRDASIEKRDELLREMGVDVADPDPDGSERERVRYYLVNELQYALYSSPTGGKLVGIENPQGHPGGTESYRQPPPEERQ